MHIEKIPFSAREVSEATNGRLIQGNPEEIFSGISLDSRTIQPGYLFIPLVGNRFDGHNFISKALEKGAPGFLTHTREVDAARSDKKKYKTAIIRVENTLTALGDLAHVWRRKHAIPLVAITGSNGKTTTKEMLGEILNLKFQVLKTEGNFNNLIGLPLTLLKLKKEDEVAVVEMGMNRRNEIKRLAEISRPDIGVITNVALAHVENFGTLEKVAAAKGELFEFMGKEGLIIINADDPHVLKLASKSRSQKVTFGINNPSDIMAKNISSEGFRKRTVFVLSIRGKEIKVELEIAGWHNIYNALAASAVAASLEVDPQTIKKGLENFKPYQMRTVIHQLKGGFTLIDDTYNANPRSMEASLKTLAEDKAGGRGIAVLGDMFELGDLAKEAHHALGEFVQKISIDYLFLLGNFSKITGRGAIKEGMSKSRVFFSNDPEELTLMIKKIIKKNDRILVKGSRGMNMEKIVNGLIGIFGLDSQ